MYCWFILRCNDEYKVEHSYGDPLYGQVSWSLVGSFYTCDAANYALELIVSELTRTKAEGLRLRNTVTDLHDQISEMITEHRQREIMSDPHDGQPITANQL